MQRLVLFLLLWFATTSSIANPLPQLFKPWRCAIVLSVSGFQQQSVAAQIQALQPQLIRQQVRVLDLQQWQQLAPYVELSGRQRRQLKDFFEVSPGQQQAWVLRYGNLISQQSAGIEFTALLQACQD